MIIQLVIVDVQEKLVLKKKVYLELMDSDSLQGALNGQEIHHAKPTRVVYKTSVDSESFYESKINMQYTPAEIIVHPW